MKLNPFKLISFCSSYWNSNDVSSVLDNSGTKDKVLKTKNIMEFLQNNISKGIAKIDSSPGLYILQISDETKCVTSIIGEINYDDKEIFFANEETHHDKLESYKKLFSCYKMQINPILTFYRDGPPISSITEKYLKNNPDIFTKINDMEYRLWKIKNPPDLDKIKNAMAKINKLYIADGHHRFSIFNDSEKKTSSRIMVSITDSNSILLKSCHRVITGDINSNWQNKISKYCTFEKISDFSDQKDKVIIKFKNGETYKILFKQKKIIETSLHYMIKNAIISDSFEVTDHQNDVFPLPGTISPTDSDKIFDLYKNGSAIIFIPDLEISNFFKILDDGNKLPPTSTWFEPKIIDGFLISKYS